MTETINQLLHDAPNGFIMLWISVVVLTLLAMSLAYHFGVMRGLSMQYTAIKRDAKGRFRR